MHGALGRGERTGDRAKGGSTPHDQTPALTAEKNETGSLEENTAQSDEPAQLEFKAAAFGSECADRPTKLQKQTLSFLLQQAPTMPAQQEMRTPLHSQPSSTSAGLPLAMKDPLGQGVWEPRKDAKTGKAYWTNHTLQKTLWDPPAGSQPVQAPVSSAPSGAPGRPAGYPVRAELVRASLMV